MCHKYPQTNAVEGAFVIGEAMDHSGIIVDIETANRVNNEGRQKLDVTVHQAVIYSGNIQADEAVKQALTDSSQEVKDASYGIIERNFLPGNVGDMTEEERQSLISLGMEQARYIAGNYMSGEQAEDYLTAMEKIAKYGMNGTLEENGKVSYDISKGRPIGAPEDYVDYEELMKNTAPETYDKLKAAVKQYLTDGTGDWISIMSDFSKKSYADKKLIDDYLKTNKEQEDKINNTEIDDTFTGVSKEDYQAFYEGLANLRETSELLKGSTFEDNMSLFSHMLLKTKYYV